MADNLQDLQRRVGQTWKEAFDGVEKTSQEYKNLVQEFTDFVADWKEFTDLRRDRLEEYLQNLDSVQTHWEDINDWVSENTDTLDEYVGSLANIQLIFQSISNEVGGLRRQTQDRVNLARQLARLASDGLSAAHQEGGLSNSAIASLDRRKVRLEDLYKLQLKELGVLNDQNEVDRAQAFRVFQEASSQAENLQRRVDRLNQLRREGVRIDNQQLRDLQERVRYHTIIADLVHRDTLDAEESLKRQLDRQKELWRIQSKGIRSADPAKDAGENAFGDRKVRIATKILKKVNLQEQAEEISRAHGEWKTDRVAAQQELELTEQRRNLASKAAKVAKTEYEELQQKQPDLAQQIQAKVSVKQDEIDTLTDKAKKLESIFETGRRENGQFASEEEIDKAFWGYNKIEDKIKELRKELAGLTEEQEEFNKKLQSAGIAADNAKILAKEAQDDFEKAEKRKVEVFSKPFGFDKLLKTALSDISGLLMTIAGLLVALIWRQLLKIDEEAVKTKRVIGQWADASAVANTKFVSGVEVLRTMRELGEQFHINPVQVFTAQELARISQAQKLTGMTAEAAGNLAVQSRIVGKNADTYRDQIAKGANAANANFHAAVNLSAVQNDVLQTSRAITLSYGNSVDRLAEASGAAHALGMNLQAVEDIAKNLMNFESSIEAEMQAQLLTGMQLNLAKAREYALNNDLGNVAEEISRQGMDAVKFSRMNYIQQEGMAKALGMSREELSKMLIMQKLNAGLTAEQVAAMTGMRRQDIEALSAQEKWQTMKQRFLEQLVPLLEPILQTVTDILIPVTKIVGGISWIISKISTLGGLINEDNKYARAFVGILTLGALAFTRHLLGIVVIGKGLGAIFRGIGTLVTRIGTGIAGWTVRLKGASAAATATGTDFVGNSVSSLGKNMTNILKGATAAALVAGAVYVLAKAAQEFAKVPWSAVGKATVGMIALVTAVTAIGAMMTAGGAVAAIAGAAAMVVIAGACYVLGKAVQQFTDIEWGDLAKAGVAILGLATIATVVGLVAPEILIGGTALSVAAVLLSGAIAILSAAVRSLTNLGRPDLSGITATFQTLAAMPSIDVGKFRSLNRASSHIKKAFKKLSKFSDPLNNLAHLGTGLQTTASAISQMGTAVGSLAANLDKLDTSKFNQFVRFSARAVSRIRSLIPNQKVEVVESSRETQGVPRESIKAAYIERTTKQAEAQKKSQQISVQQKTADLSRIEKKMDELERAIVGSRPDWNWLEFERARRVNVGA